MNIEAAAHSLALHDDLSFILICLVQISESEATLSFLSAS